MNNSYVLEFEDVCKNYTMGTEEVKALRGVNLKIIKGSFIAIMGPSDLENQHYSI